VSAAFDESVEASVGFLVGLHESLGGGITERQAQLQVDILFEAYNLLPDVFLLGPEVDPFLLTGLQQFP
jgi:hypothetical protein